MGKQSYDEIGLLYAKHRRPDPRIAAAINRALGPAASIVDCGAGTGSYEPADRRVYAVEPSNVMIRQRSSNAAPAIRASAESLPFRSESFDAALAVLTIHHWGDWVSGLREMRRVARRVVVLTFDVAFIDTYWLTRDYIPAGAAFDRTRIPSMNVVADVLGATRIERMAIPHDCVDGFLCAYWRRPQAYLDPEVRACISNLAMLDPLDVLPGIARLRSDVESGRWHERYADLLRRDELDCGYRLVVRE